MSDRRHPFLQTLTVDGVQISNEHIVTFTYIEEMDLSGAKIILGLRDEYSNLRDSGILKKGVSIVCEMADHAHLNTQTIHETFVLSTFPIENGVIKIEALQLHAHNIKQLAAKPRFFVSKSPKEVLTALFPDLSVQCTVSKGKGTYHLNSGATVSRLLRKMARDFGAAVWIARGSVHFHSLIELSSKQGEKSFATGRYKSGVDMVIQRLSVINNEALYQRVMQKQWMSQSPNKGLIKANGNKDKPIVMLPQKERWQIENQSLFVQPRIDILIDGLGDVEPSLAIDVELNKLAEGGGIDESVEPTLLVQQVCHHQEKLNYVARIKLGVVNRA